MVVVVKMKRKWKMKFEDTLEKYNNYVIYGFGKPAEIIYDYIMMMSKVNSRIGKIRGYTCSDNQLIAKEKNGVSIKYISEYINYSVQDLIVVATAQIYHSNIFEILKEKGFRNIFIIDEQTLRLCYTYNLIAKKLGFLKDSFEEIVLIKSNNIDIMIEWILKNVVNFQGEIIKIDWEKIDEKKGQLKNKKVILAIEREENERIEKYQKINSVVKVENIIDIFSISMYYDKTLYLEPNRLNFDLRWGIIETISKEIYQNRIEGNVCEVGVFCGDTARYINELFPDRKLFLFDSFEGFDKEEQRNEDDKGMYNLKIDYSTATEESVMKKMIYPKQCVIRKGYFPQTAEGINEVFCFVRLDMDLYESTKLGLEFFSKRMSKGGVILVHDCKNKNFDGASIALREFCKKSNIQYFIMPDELGTAVIKF